MIEPFSFVMQGQMMNLDKDYNYLSVNNVSEI